MNKYNFFISYCHADGREIAEQISKQLTVKGYSVFMDIETLQSGSDYTKTIAEAIANSDYFIPIITEGYNSSQWAIKELSFACSESRGRSKKVIPIIMTNEISPIIEYDILPLQCLKLDFKLELADAIDKIIKKIDSIASWKLKSEILYEKLAEFRNLKNPNKEAEILCELITLTRRSKAPVPTKSWCKEILSLYENLSRYTGSYDKESINIAHKILKEIDTTQRIWTGTEKTQPNKVFYTDIFYISFVLRMIYMDREIRKECADITTHGNAHNACPTMWYIEKQKVFVEAYYREQQSIKNNFSINDNEEEKAFITDTINYIFENIAIGSTVPHTPKKKKLDKVELSKNDEILVSVAKFMREGNKLFDVLQKNGIAGDFLKCLLTSYERLKNYCEIVGASTVAAECIDRIVEIRNELDKHQNSDIQENEKVEKGIKSLLGFTLKNTGNYDVFISFKNEDSDLAEKIYRYCHKHMKEPFWSKKSLPELSKSEYEDAIYAALRNSKHFVIVLSNLEYLNTNWIKTEMSTFHRAITEGRKEGANFVFVVTDDVYKAIIDSNKMCLDERYCGYQIIKMSEYEETLAQYIS